MARPEESLRSTTGRVSRYSATTIRQMPDGEQGDGGEAVDGGGEGHPGDADQAFGRAEQHVGPGGQRVVVDAAGHLDADEAAQGGEEAADGQDDEGGQQGGPLGLGPELLPAHDQQDEHRGAHGQRDEVGRVDDVEHQRAAEQRHRHDPGAPLPTQDAPRQHDHPDAGDGHQGAGRLHDGDGQVLRNEVQVGAQGRGDRGEQVDHAGHEERHGGDAPDAAHADAVGGHLGRRWPGGAAGPSGGQLGMDVGRLGAALDHDVGRDQPLAQGGHGQVRLGQQQAHVQVGPGLDLEGRLLAVVQEGGREAEAPAVLVDHLGGGAGAGEEPGVEVGELGHERAADDHPRRARPRRPPAPCRGRPGRRRRAARGRWGACPIRARTTAPAGLRRPRARQMPRDVTATTMASTTRSATAMATVTMKRENHEAS